MKKTVFLFLVLVACWVAAHWNGDHRAAAPLSHALVQVAGGAQDSVSVSGARGPASAVSQAPRTLEPSLASQSVSKLEEYKLIAVEESPLNPKGEYERIKIFETGGEIPLLRIVEKRVKLKNGSDRLVSTTEMAADHVVVKLNEGLAEEDLSRIAERFGAQIIHRFPRLRAYTLKFDGRDPLAMGRLMEDLTQSGAAQKAEPDYIYRPI